MSDFTPPCSPSLAEGLALMLSDRFSPSITAPESERPLMRWAAQSELISSQLMPHTFSV